MIRGLLAMPPGSDVAGVVELPVHQQLNSADTGQLRQFKDVQIERLRDPSKMTQAKIPQVGIFDLGHHSQVNPSGFGQVALIPSTGGAQALYGCCQSLVFFSFGHWFTSRAVLPPVGRSRNHTDVPTFMLWDLVRGLGLDNWW